MLPHAFAFVWFYVLHRYASGLPCARTSKRGRTRKSRAEQNGAGLRWAGFPLIAVCLLIFIAAAGDRCAPRQRNSYAIFVFIFHMQRQRQQPPGPAEKTQAAPGSTHTHTHKQIDRQYSGCLRLRYS